MNPIPYPDALDLIPRARRAALVRMLLAGCLVGLVLVVALLSRNARSGRPSFLPSDRTGIVVLDVSASITADKYAQIHNTLAQLADTRARYGLVIFSSVAYEALPPGSPASALKPLVRLFTPPPDNAPRHLPPPAPWQDFSSVTMISSGLALARGLIAKNHIRRPAVLLISDLQDDFTDVTALTKTVFGYRVAHIPLKVIALKAERKDVALFEGISSAPVTNAPLPPTAGSNEDRHSATVFPGRIGLAAILFIALLASNELWCVRLRWRDRSEAA
jgi:hypothetical protein